MASTAVPLRQDVLREGYPTYQKSSSVPDLSLFSVIFLLCSQEGRHNKISPIVYLGYMYMSQVGCVWTFLADKPSDGSRATIQVPLSCGISVVRHPRSVLFYDISLHISSETELLISVRLPVYKLIFYFYLPYYSQYKLNAKCN